MFDGPSSLSDVHEVVHTVGDFVGGIGLLVAGYWLSRYGDHKAALEKGLRELQDWKIKIEGWQLRLEEWQIRLEKWQIRIEDRFIRKP